MAASVLSVFSEFQKNRPSFPMNELGFENVDFDNLVRFAYAVGHMVVFLLSSILGWQK